MSKQFEGVTAPYNFVPFADTVVSPDWHDAVSMDHPFEDGLCGEIELTLTAHSPLMVGNEKKDGVTEFFRNHRGLAIPGSSLKGMVRNVMEIAGFGKMPQPNDVSPTKRVLQVSQNTPVKSGWLTFDSEANRYTVLPCRYANISFKELGAKFPAWKRVESEGDIEARYNAIGGLGNSLEFSVRAVYNKDRGFWERDLAEAGDAHLGVIVLTGPGQKKNHEFVFYPRPNAQSLPVSESLARRFLNIYDNPNLEFNQFRYLRNLVAESAGVAPGIPVFYLEEGNSGKITDMGFAKAMKLYPQNSVQQLHAKQFKRHEQTRDLVSVLLGYADENVAAEQQQFKGRLAFSDFALQTGSEAENPVKILLSSPAASYYPAYLQQGDNGRTSRLPYAQTTYRDVQAKLRGFKRYPVQHNASLAPDMSYMEEADNNNEAIYSRIRPLKTGATFTGKVRFHNVRPVELGMLLWSLTFGGNPNRYHSLGMAKPYGYGKVSCEVTSLRAEHNSAPGELNDELNKVDMYRDAFTAFMDKHTADSKKQWQDSAVMQELLAMAEGTEASDNAIKYMPLAKYMDTRDKELRKETQPGFALPKFSVLKAKS